MSKVKRNYGEFADIAGNIWRVELWHDRILASAGELTFPATEALIIEWPSAAIEEPICKSTATLRVISPTDRRYVDFYTTTPGQIRLDVYRNNALYWSGCFDPEFYEEPYESAQGYEVSLTFSDFGVLDRLKFNLTEKVTISRLLSHCIEKTQINTTIDETRRSLKTADGTALSLADIYVLASNFYDEDDEAATLQEALAGALQPLGLKIIQKGGKLWVHDINGVCSSAAQRDIYWSSTSQTLAMDSAYNNVKICFSPYSDEQLMGSDVKPTGSPTSETTYYPYYTDSNVLTNPQAALVDKGYEDFRISLYTSADGVASIDPNARAFEIKPVLGSVQTTTGIAWKTDDTCGKYPAYALANAANRFSSGRKVFRSMRCYIPPMASHITDRFLRVRLPLLADARYNPYQEGEDVETDEGWWTRNNHDRWEGLKKYGHVAFIPVAISLFDADGREQWHFENWEITKTSAQGSIGWAARGQWVRGAASPGKCWLAYYDVNDVQDGDGVGGWKTNSHNVGLAGFWEFDESVRNKTYGSNSKFRISEIFRKVAEGEYIPYPHVGDGGYWLEISVYDGIRNFGDWRRVAAASKVAEGNGTALFDVDWYKENSDTADDFAGTDGIVLQQGLQNWYRWLMYQPPTVEICNGDGLPDDVSSEDAEYSGRLDDQAKDELKFDTICGTSPKELPSARGLYRWTATDIAIAELKRGDFISSPERLFIGTMYTHYASRHIKLTGEHSLVSSSLCTGDALYRFIEPNQAGKVFMAVAARHDAQMNCSEAEFVEIENDKYTSIDEF